MRSRRSTADGRLGRVVWRGVLGVVACVGGVGCVGGAGSDDCADLLCGPAAPPLEVIVRGVADASVTVTRPDGTPVETSCEALADTVCTSEVSPSEAAAGAYQVHVTAPGYQPLDTTIVVEATAPGGCCNPGYVASSVTLELTPT